MSEDTPTGPRFDPQVGDTMTLTQYAATFTVTERREKDVLCAGGGGWPLDLWAAADGAVWARPPKVNVPDVLRAVAAALREYDLDPVRVADASPVLFRLIVACDSAAGNAGNTWTDLAAVYDASAAGGAL